MTTVSLTPAAADTPAQPTPSQQIVQDANRVVRVTDATGRVIGVKRMTMSMRRRVFKAISGENQGKERYLGLAVLAACVCEIDGQPIVLPSTELQFDALIDRLDDPGFDAIALAIQEFAPADGGAASAAGE